MFRVLIIGVLGTTISVNLVLSAPQTNDNASVAAPFEVPKLPPVYGEAQYSGDYLPGSNTTYGLTLRPVDPSTERISEVWLHRVTMRVPGRTEEEMLRVGTMAGMTSVVSRGKDRVWMQNGDVVLNQAALGPRRQSRALYKHTTTRSGENLRELPGNGTNQYEFAKAEMQRLGLWPEYARNLGAVPVISNSCEDTPGSFAIAGGWLEGFPIVPSRYLADIAVVGTKCIARAEVCFSKTARYAKVRTKSIEKAFEELNKGYGTALDVYYRGSEVRYDSVWYAAGGMADDWMYPIYRFHCFATNGSFLTRLELPAVANEYFADPTRQVVGDLMLIEEERGSWVVDPERVAALRFDPDAYLARPRAAEVAKSKEQCMSLVESALAIVIGRLERGKIAGEWEVVAEQSYDFTEGGFLPEFRKKQLREPILLSAAPPTMTNRLARTITEHLYPFNQVELTPSKADEQFTEKAKRGRVLVVRMPYHDEIWSGDVVISWRYAQEMESSTDLLRTVYDPDFPRFALPQRNVLSCYAYEPPHPQFGFLSVEKQIEFALICAEKVKQNCEAVAKKRRGETVDERIRIANKGLPGFALLARDSEPRVRREVASSSSASEEMLLYLLKNDPDEEVRVRAKSAYEKNYGKLLPRKEDKKDHY
jgi:hypothetical protein